MQSHHPPQPYRQSQPNPAAAAAHDASPNARQRAPAVATATHQMPPPASHSAPHAAAGAAQAVSNMDGAMVPAGPAPFPPAQEPPQPIEAGISPATLGVHVWCPLSHVRFEELPHVYQPLPPWGQIGYLESLIIYVQVTGDEFWTVVVPGYDFTRAYRAPQHAVAFPPNGSQLTRLEPFGIWFQIFRAYRGCTIADCPCRFGAPNFRQY